MTKLDSALLRSIDVSKDVIGDNGEEDEEVKEFKDVRKRMTEGRKR